MLEVVEIPTVDNDARRIHSNIYPIRCNKLRVVDTQRYFSADY